MTLPDRFWDKVCPEPNSGCWLWIACVQSAGYGQYAVRKGDIRYAHRVSYEAEHGPIPDGLVIDHLCRNPPCVNPRHLEAVTTRENLMRGVSPNVLRALANTCKRGHPLTDERDRGGRRVQCRACHREYERVRKRSLGIPPHPERWKSNAPPRG